MILILMLPIFDAIQQKEVGGNDDLRPVKVIAADPDVDWAAEEGMPLSMVSLRHYVSLSLWCRLAIVFSWMISAKCTFLTYFVPNLLTTHSRRKLAETMIFAPLKSSLLIPMWIGLPRKACPLA